MSDFDGRSKACEICGYDKVVEVAHIRDISSFCDDTLMSVVNSPNNLMWLCPNHHAELDMGLLEV